MRKTKVARKISKRVKKPRKILVSSRERRFVIPIAIGVLPVMPPAPRKRSFWAAILGKKFSVAKSSLILALVVGLNLFGFLSIGNTVAFYNDIEISSGNAHTAGSLDFALVPVSHAKSIGLAEEVSISSVLVNSGALDWQYTLEAEKISGDDDFCSALGLESKLNGVEKYDGSLLSLDVLPLATLGTWKFNIELPVDAVGIAHGDTCEVDFVYKGWQKEIPLYEDSGFTDEERISVTLTARMIVLNEFLPRPSGVAYGFDFGNDSSDMPQGEWVELYNNGTEDVNLSGWYIRDSTPGEGNKTDITALNTSPAGTIIGGKSWLVVYMNKPILDNTGDTVRLFDDSDNLIDSHSYDDPDFCEIEPTPGDENSTTASGSCGSVPPNKSYARIPDGIGDWVDPIPTPGGVNRLETLPLNDAGAGSAFTEISPEDENILINTDGGLEQMNVGLTDGSGSIITNEESEEVIAPVSEEEIIITPEETAVTEETLPTEEPAAEIVTEEAILPVENSGNSEPAEEIVVIEEQPAIIENQPVIVEEIVAEPTPAPEPPASEPETAPAEEPIEEPAGETNI